MKDLWQIVITRNPAGLIKITSMGEGETLDDQHCEVGAVLPVVAALLKILVAPEQKK